MSVTAAQGFVASGVTAGIRPSGKPDVAVVRSLPRAVGAALWTTNRVEAAPVTVSKRHLAVAEPQAVLINAGVANAATGDQGEADAVASAEALAQELGLETEEILVLSTGVIGVRLPVDKVLAGGRAAAAQLSPDGGAAAASAILTTDSGPKVAVVASGGFTVGGMAKGAGMIHPRLATMLVVITTDYPLAAGEADVFLRPAVAQTFNRISVDGDCSTNDAVVLLANGASAAARDDAVFADALGEVCADLARQIVADGEGATVVLEIGVTGAASGAEAEAIARRIATSPLVKTAAFGHDPNWGRVLAAAGSAPYGDGFARLETGRLTVAFGGVAVFAAGAPTGAVPDSSGAVCRIDLDLGLGDGTAGYLASDLTYDYVRINADYTT
ncbi:MAG: bifunctional glutamate N-acetyltransferase/amino-acid acetyltransferase ArgJ [Thermoleophilia bacterium]